MKKKQIKNKTAFEFSLFEKVISTENGMYKRTIYGKHCSQYALY